MSNPAALDHRRPPAGPAALSEDNGLGPCAAWFRQYARRYPQSGPQDDPFALKREHTWRVLVEARLITAGERGWLLPPRLIHLAALLHDVGRFPQLQRFGTLSDRHSLNHAALGVRVLRAEGVLDHLPAEERRLVLGAVQLHNRRLLPPGLPPRLAQAARALRDADKLDVLGLAADKLDPALPLDRRAFPNLTPHPSCYTHGVLEQIQERRMVRVEDLRWSLDAVLLFLSWVYDLNFQVTRREVARRAYVERLGAYLPPEQALTSLRARLLADLSSA